MKFRILTVLLLTALTITTASAQYVRTDLVSNQPGVAPITDPHLVNAWASLHSPPAPGGPATMAPETPACTTRRVSQLSPAAEPRIS